MTTRNLGGIPVQDENLKDQIVDLRIKAKKKEKTTITVSAGDKTIKIRVTVKE